MAGPAAQAATRVPGGHPEGYLEAFAQIYRDFAEDLRDAQAGRTLAPRVPGLDDGVRSLVRRLGQQDVTSGRGGRGA